MEKIEEEDEVWVI